MQFLAHVCNSADLCLQADALDQQIAKEGTESLGVLAGIPIAVKASRAQSIKQLKADSN